VLKSRVRGQNRVVRLNYRRGGLGRRVDAELELALLAVVDRETLHEKGTKPGTSTTTKRVEDEEALKTHTVVRDTADLFQDSLNQLLADCVVTACVVVGSILGTCYHVLWVEETTVGTRADFVDDIGFEITVDGARHVLALA